VFIFIIRTFVHILVWCGRDILVFFVYVFSYLFGCILCVCVCVLVYLCLCDIINIYMYILIYTHKRMCVGVFMLV